MIKESLPPINNVIYVRCKVLDTPLVLESIFKPNKVKNKPKLNIVIEENLNIGQIIDEKNKDKKKIMKFFLYQLKIKIVINI